MKLFGSPSLLNHIPYAAGGFVLFFVLGAAGFVGLQHTAPKQPIAFNHAKHVSNGVACTDCHAGVQTQAKATLPSVDLCIGCHQVALTNSAEEERVRTVAAAGQELNWVQLTQTAPHIFFSHRRHVAVAHLPCAECHGPMEQATKPPDRAFRVFSMATCIGCHQQHRVNADCNDCHR
ncbi:MAG: cytochrome c family protein [Acidobacteriia bacterium]|nr:cytochrome c family protein [Terriglobia bacterium]